MKQGTIVLRALMCLWLAICTTGAAVTECTRASARSVSQAALYNCCAGEKTRLAQIQTQICARCGGCR